MKNRFLAGLSAVALISGLAFAAAAPARASDDKLIIDVDTNVVQSNVVGSMLASATAKAKYGAAEANAVNVGNMFDLSVDVDAMCNCGDFERIKVPVTTGILQGNVVGAMTAGASATAKGGAAAATAFNGGNIANVGVKVH